MPIFQDCLTAPPSSIASPFPFLTHLSPASHLAGLGKSAMLANWMQRRAANMHRDDFLFKHFVGSSTASCQLSDMLFRLESALKVHFHLREMEVRRPLNLPFVLFRPHAPATTPFWWEIVSPRGPSI